MVEVIKMREKVGMGALPSTLLIGGEWKGANSGKSFPSLNPATGESIGDVSDADAGDVEAAVRAARAAFEERRWLSMPYPQRAKIMFNIADRIEADLEGLAVNEVLENGAPLALARGSIINAAEAFRYYGGWIGKIHGQTGELGAGDAFHAYTLKEPVGVAALIVPWN